MFIVIIHRISYIGIGIGIVNTGICHPHVAVGRAHRFSVFPAYSYNSCHEFYILYGKIIGSFCYVVALNLKLTVSALFICKLWNWNQNGFTISLFVIATASSEKWWIQIVTKYFHRINVWNFKTGVYFTIGSILLHSSTFNT